MRALERARPPPGSRALTALDTTTTSAPATFSARWPSMHRARRALQAPRHRVGLEVRALHVVAQVQQHLGDAAHAAAADADEVDGVDAAHAVVHARASCRGDAGVREPLGPRPVMAVAARGARHRARGRGRAGPSSSRSRVGQRARRELALRAAAPRRPRCTSELGVARLVVVHGRRERHQHGRRRRPPRVRRPSARRRGRRRGRPSRRPRPCRR